MIILYSTDCPRCHILEKKLDAAKIEYTTNKNVDEMLAKGMEAAPALEVNGELMDFGTAVKWINSRGEN